MVSVLFCYWLFVLIDFILSFNFMLFVNFFTPFSLFRCKLSKKASGSM